MDTARPLLLGSGISDAVVNTLQEQSNIELDTARVPGLIRIQTVYAIKKH